MLRLHRRDLLIGGAAGMLGARTARAQAPKRGGTLNAIVTPEPPVLVLGINYQGPTQLVGGKIYQGLCKYSHKLEPLPGLAKSWTLSDDKRTYTFHLQENVKFHDGMPMTADDVIFSITQFQKTLSPRARPIFDKIKQATAPDPLTVTFTLDTPFEPFMLMFDVTASAIVPKHIYAGTDYMSNPANQHPIGTGPFQFVEWKRGDFIHLKRFEQYYKPGQPYLDEIIFHVIPDSQSRALALETGKVQLATATDIEPFDVPRFKAMPNFVLETTGYEYPSPITWFEINHRVKPLGDVRVRQAISHAIDRNFIVNRLWSGIGKVATGPIASTTPYYDPAVARLQPFDPRAAMQLLDAAGYPANAKGVRFTIKQLGLPYGEVYNRLSEYFRSALEKVGIEVILESTDAGAWVGRLGNWDFDTTVNSVSQFGDPTLGVERSYVSSNIKKLPFTNTAGYSNPEVDKLFETARLSPDHAVRQRAFTAVQKILCDEVPEIWVKEDGFPTVHAQRLHNVIPTGIGANSDYDDTFFS